MAVSDYSTNPGSNLAIAGIDLAENCSPAGINNAIRTLMADIATFAGGGSGGSQPLDATLTAFAALVFTPDTMFYATGNDQFATFPITAFGRSLLGASDASGLGAIIGTGATLSGAGGTSWSIALGGGIVMTGRTITIPASSSTTFTFGNGHTYASWANAWMSGDDSNADVSSSLVSNSLTGATIYSHASGTVFGQLLSIGV